MSLLETKSARSSTAVTSILDLTPPGLHADDIIARLLREYPKRVKDAVVSVRNSSPIPGLGVAGGFKIMVEDRGGRGLEVLQTQTDALTRRLQGAARPGRRLNRLPLAHAADLPGHRPDQGRGPGRVVR